MGPWVYVCEQCNGKSCFQVSDMLLPQVTCSHCGHPKINSPEAIARTRTLLDQHNWYAGFLELLMGMEDKLGIEFTDDDFPRPFVTWRQLLEVTGSRCDTSVKEEDIIAVMAALSSITTEAIREGLDNVINYQT